MKTPKILTALLASTAFITLAYAGDFTPDQLIILKEVAIVMLAKQNCPGVHMNNSAISLELNKFHLDAKDTAFFPAVAKLAQEVIADTNGDEHALCTAIKDDSLPFRVLVHIDQ